MSSKPRLICQFCFCCIVMLGLGAIANGFVQAAIPYAQLDALLPPEELADVQVRENRLELFQAARGQLWLAWIAFGFVLVTVGSIGVWATRKIEGGANAGQPDMANDSSS